MNQILQNDNQSIENKNHSQKPTKKIFKIQLFICIFIILVSSIIYFTLKFNASEKEKIAKQLLHNFSITTLYANTNQLSSSATQVDITQNTENPFVIGLIKIDKIKLVYPILSITTDDFLKIAPCRFDGPLPNQVGNLCIAGHNYVDNKLFSNVYKLEEGDSIRIYGLDGNYIDYSVFSKTEVVITDLSCTSQETNGTKIITLITCNNVKNTRVIVQAKEQT